MFLLKLKLSNCFVYFQPRSKVPVWTLGQFFRPQALIAILKQDYIRNHCGDRSGYFDQIVVNSDITPRDVGHVCIIIQNMIQLVIQILIKLEIKISLRIVTKFIKSFFLSEFSKYCSDRWTYWPPRLQIRCSSENLVVLYLQ